MSWDISGGRKRLMTVDSELSLHRIRAHFLPTESLCVVIDIIQIIL